MKFLSKHGKRIYNKRGTPLKNKLSNYRTGKGEESQDNGTDHFYKYYRRKVLKTKEKCIHTNTEHQIC